MSDVLVTAVAPRPTAVVPAVTTWAAFPRVWKGLLDQVWDELRAAGITRGCPNVMLYLDDVPHVEVGVLFSQPVPLAEPVVLSELPGGRVAMTVHRGPYATLGEAHDAVQSWCVAHGLPLAGPRWEIYGSHRDDPAELETTVYYLLTGPRE
ncbi:GyrI-like domain-containing protein [Paractinoplanes globisporus]|uniref:GyrI-like domain-containing protein n=1 Tax=Paractinoplanes globisporus TaxID=113565 RepID=A0ABW6W513_9ACTN|nr:GyrI-like domain-containing protein [Actinoplanes globisporus]